MKWDASRPVLWQRLIREWVLYVAVMAVLFIAFFNDRNLLGIFGGLLISGPIFLAFGYVLAKFGYQRKTFKDLRAKPKTERSGDASAAPSTASNRPKPPPTKRTGGGQQRPGGARTRR